MIIPVDPEYTPIPVVPPEQLQVSENDSMVWQFLRSTGHAIAGAYEHAAGGIVGTAQKAAESLHFLPVNDNFLATAKQKITNSEKKVEITPHNSAEWAGNVFGGTLGFMSQMILAGGWAGRIAASGLAFAIEGQDAYDKAITRGASEKDANLERGLVGTVNAALMGLNIDKLLKFSKTAKIGFADVRKAIEKRAWDEAKAAGGKLTVQGLRNAINDGLTIGGMEGARIELPRIFEGSKAVPVKEDGSIDNLAILEQVSASSLAGAVASPFLALAKAGISVAGMPSEKAVTRLKQAVIESQRSTDLSPAKMASSLQRFKLITNSRDVKLSMEELYRDDKNGFARRFIQENFPELPKDIRVEYKDTDDPELLNKKGTLWTDKNKIVLDKNLPVNEQISVLATELSRAKYLSGEGAQPGQIFDPREVEKQVRLAKKQAQGFVVSTNNYYNFLEKLYNNVLNFKDMITAGKYKRFLPMKDVLQPQDIKNIVQHIKTSPDFQNKPALVERVVNTLSNLFTGKELPEVKNMKELEPLLGKPITDQLISIRESVARKNAPLASKLWRAIIEPANLSKALMASLDQSGLLRQGYFTFARHPVMGMRAAMVGYRSYVSPEYAEYMNLMMETHPLFKYAQLSKLAKTEFGKMDNSEEYFNANLAQKAPGVQAAERSYVNVLNYFRYNLFYKTVEGWIGRGKLSLDTGVPKGEYAGEMENLARILNHLTGRGDIKALKKFAPFFNITFFSPAMQQSHVQKVTDLFDIREGYKLGSPVRKLLAGHLVAGVATGLSVLALAKLAQEQYGKKVISVEADPRSSDFGKIKMGDTRIDFWAGYSQIARLVTQVAMGEKLTTGEGKIVDVNRIATIARYLQSKLSPAAGFAVDMARGQDYMGNELDVSPENLVNQGYQRFTPLFAQDIVNAIQYQGLGGPALLSSGLGLHGIGIQTYPESESTKLAEIKDHYSVMMYGSSWQELGPTYQQLLKMEFPLIQEQEYNVSRELLSKTTQTRFIKDVRDSEKQILSNLPKGMRDELDKLLVDVGGISRNVGSGWYLNDQRYLRYKKDIADGLKEELPMFLGMNLPPMFKKQFIEHVIETVKQEARNKLMADADMKDLQRGYRG